jgi:mRNA-degrading endonuclease YafQ of YafQ-DinJ toxin-antitoxin module
VWDIGARRAPKKIFFGGPRRGPGECSPEGDFIFIYKRNIKKKNIFSFLIITGELFFRNGSPEGDFIFVYKNIKKKNIFSFLIITRGLF